MQTNEKLLEQYHNGGDRATIEEKLRQANSGLVYAVARKYGAPGYTHEDLVQEGYVGLLKAVRKFDPERGLRFSTYAMYWIRQRMARTVKTGLLRRPEWVTDLLARYLNVYKQELKGGHTAEDAHVMACESVGRSKKDLEAKLSHSQHPASLESEIKDSILLKEQFAEGASVEDLYARRHNHHILEKAMAKLPEREQEILHLRYGFDDPAHKRMSRRKVGRRLGLSAERIRQIEKRALQALYEEMEPQTL